jgi:DNA polymerase-3 subunit alpha
MTDFVNLHTQTTYSILDSLIEPKDLFEHIKTLGQSAVGITDHNSLASTWDAWKASQETGVKFIVGCELYFVNDIKVEQKLRHIVLIAKNAIGYKNLLTLNKKGFDHKTFNGKRIYSVIDWNLLQQHKEGLICLTACGNGIISQLLMSQQFNEAESSLLKLKELFNDNLGIEVQPNNMKRGSNAFNDAIDQNFLNRQLYNLGKKHNIKVVAACNAHYLNKDDNETHDVLLAIGAGQPIYSNFRLKYPVSDFYLKSGEEVKAFFTRNYGEDAAQEFCDNSLYFANLCETPNWIDPQFSNNNTKELPIFPIENEPDYQSFLSWKNNQNSILQPDSAYLRYKCFQSFENFKLKIKPEQIEQYINRIETELSVLDHQKFSSYMLIVADYVNWAKNNGVPVGPGRGSGAGSLVGYLLNIHEADPIKYDLLFERFQTIQRTEPPDYDVDFGTIGRYKVVDYIINKYGEDYVAGISNFNTITPKVYARDVSRSCELGGSKEMATKLGNDIAGIIYDDVKSAQALNNIPLYSEYAKKYPELKKYDKIVGQKRNCSQHAAGLIIGKRPLVGLVPLRRDKDGFLCLEYEKNTSEEVGLVKMDLLGLSTLDDIAATNKLIIAAGKKVPVINYDDNDEKTYDLISKGDTYGVFQFGTSGGTINLCKKIKPKNMDDLTIITTLARPAAADIRKDFIETREGKRQFSLSHPLLAGAFANTYGFGLYDESILKLGADVAGWNLNEADRIRKMIKSKGKNPEKDKKLRKEFIESAMKNNNLTERVATNIWDDEIKSFGLYTFCRSHALTYSLLTYHTAYLKAHFPIEFLMANLMAEVKSGSPKAPGNIAKIKQEIRKNKVKIISPNINDSQLTYTIKDGNNLITGLDAIKFVGDDAIKDIINKRPFKDFFDFMVRVSSKTVRANSIQALAACGTLDCFNLTRKQMFLYCSDYRKKLQIWLKKHDPNTEIFNYPFPEGEWSKPEIYALEQFYIGESFICKPPIAYGEFFSDYHNTIKEVKRSKEKTNFNVKGIITDFFEFKVKKENSKYYGQPMVKAVIEDKNGDQCSLTIFPDSWKLLHERIKELNKKATFGIGMALFFSGTSNNYEDNMGLILDRVFNIAVPPIVPNDLKPKKINLKTVSKPKNAQEFLDSIEENLINEGLIDLEDS